MHNAKSTFMWGFQMFKVLHVHLSCHFYNSFIRYVIMLMGWAERMASMRSPSGSVVAQMKFKLGASWFVAQSVCWTSLSSRIHLQLVLLWRIYTNTLEAEVIVESKSFHVAIPFRPCHHQLPACQQLFRESMQIQIEMRLELNEPFSLLYHSSPLQCYRLKLQFRNTLYVPAW